MNKDANDYGNEKKESNQSQNAIQNPLIRTFVETVKKKIEERKKNLAEKIDDVISKRLH